MDIDDALEILGPIRATKQGYFVRKGKTYPYETPRLWLDGRKDVTAMTVIRAAHLELVRRRKVVE